LRSSQLSFFITEILQNQPLKAYENRVLHLAWTGPRKVLVRGSPYRGRTCTGGWLENERSFCQSIEA
jgi:hypothetical protein